MKRCHILIALLCAWFAAQAQVDLSDEARFTWITCHPSPDQVYTLFGHTALRVIDPANDLDCTFNYGVFSFDQPHFVPKFIKGETDYQLGISNTQSFLRGYYRRGSIVYEQTLNLTPSEKQRLWKALCTNYRPENRTYRYNFIFDNCVTRPITILQMSTEGEIIYGGHLLNTTYRQLVTDYVGYDNWTMFGIDLVFGTPADKPIGSHHEELFLPMYARERLHNAVVISDGEPRPLIIDEHQYDAVSKPAAPTLWLLRPSTIFTLLLLLVFPLTILEGRKKKCFVWLDVILFAVVGLLGIIIFYLMFISVHPLVQNNWNLAWAHPLQLLFAILLCIKPLRKYILRYQYINTFAILITLIVGVIGIQQLHAALWPLLVTLLLRSIVNIRNNRTLQQ